MQFWNLFKELVLVVYYSEPKERLGVTRQLMEDNFGYRRTDVYDRVEGTLLRVVAYMEEFKDKDDDGE